MTDLISRLASAVANCEADPTETAEVMAWAVAAGVTTDTDPDTTETDAALEGIQFVWLRDDGESDCHTHGHTVVTLWPHGLTEDRRADTDEIPPSHMGVPCGYALWSNHWTCDNCITRQQSVKSLSDKNRLGKYTICGKCRRQFASNPARALPQLIENMTAPASTVHRACDMCLD